MDVVSRDFIFLMTGRRENTIFFQSGGVLFLLPWMSFQLITENQFLVKWKPTCFTPLPKWEKTLLSGALETSPRPRNLAPEGAGGPGGDCWCSSTVRDCSLKICNVCSYVVRQTVRNAHHSYRHRTKLYQSRLQCLSMQTLISHGRNLEILKRVLTSVIVQIWNVFW